MADQHRPIGPEDERFFPRLRTGLEILGGCRPLPGGGVWRDVAFGLWWVVLALTVLAFAGRGAKFIYIDF
jgi:hypothetical protein